MHPEIVKYRGYRIGVYPPFAYGFWRVLVHRGPALPDIAFFGACNSREAAIQRAKGRIDLALDSS